jgi:hypothetical protein
MMTKSTQNAGELRNIGSIPNIGKGVLSTLKRPHQLFDPSAACQGVQDDLSVWQNSQDVALFCVVQF